MAKVLIIFAHPLLETSRVHSELVHRAKKVPGVTLNDLYENYPDFDIDKEREKALLLTHDIIIWQHPFYWYSAPALLKQWLDLVLEHGWAYGKHGKALVGKTVFNVISTGGSSEAYQHGARNRYPISDYLKPFEQTALLCNMQYWPPFWIPGVHRMEVEDIGEQGAQYQQLLQDLTSDVFTEQRLLGKPQLNNLPTFF